MPDSPVSLTSGLGETVLPAPPDDAARDLAAARDIADATERRTAVSRVVASYPAFLEAWADLGAAARDRVEAYACYRVGYHRGLDALRGAGWRGSGYVRWAQPSNRGFLRSLVGLADTAADLGEVGEAERCRTFAAQLDPDWAGDRDQPGRDDRGGS